MTQSPNTLQQIAEQILVQSSQLLASGHQVLSVFDLDSTLFDVGPRIQKILHDFAAQPEIQALDPVIADRIGKIQTQRKDWGIRTAIEREGIHTLNPEIVLRARKFWVTHFFSNDYLRFDQPMLDAVPFVRLLKQMGSQIIYLTGRETSKMQKGSLEVLRQHQFPLSENGQELVMKPSTGVEDHRFKEDWFAGLPHHDYSRIWFFENEPINLEKIRVKHPEVRLIFIDSTHSSRAPVPTDLWTLEDFRIDWNQLKSRLAPIHQKWVP